MHRLQIWEPRWKTRYPALHFFPPFNLLPNALTLRIADLNLTYQGQTVVFGHRSEAIDKKTRQIKEMISTIRQTNKDAERELSKKLERKIKRQQIFDIRRRHLKQKRQNKKCVLNLVFFIWKYFCTMKSYIVEF